MVNRVDRVASASDSTLESKMTELVDQVKAINLNVRSAVNDSVGAALAIQARRGPNSEGPSQVEHELYIPHPSLTKMLRKFLGNSSAMFKTPEQAEAVEFVLDNEDHLLLVGPTAMGKTLAYMIPAVEREHGITCVLLPLSALHTDFDRRCRELKIEHSRWTRENDAPRTTIVYVSPEHAQTKQFFDYVVELCNIGLLKQFVIDEAHLVASQKDFRFCFLNLKPLLTCGAYENKLC